MSPRCRQMPQSIQLYYKLSPSTQHTAGRAPDACRSHVSNESSAKNPTSLIIKFEYNPSVCQRDVIFWLVCRVSAAEFIGELSIRFNSALFHCACLRTASKSCLTTTVPFSTNLAAQSATALWFVAVAVCSASCVALLCRDFQCKSRIHCGIRLLKVEFSCTDKMQRCKIDLHHHWFINQIFSAQSRISILPFLTTCCFVSDKLLHRVLDVCWSCFCDHNWIPIKLTNYFQSITGLVVQSALLRMVVSVWACVFVYFCSSSDPC